MEGGRIKKKIQILPTLPTPFTKHTHSVRVCVSLFLYPLTEHVVLLFGMAQRYLKCHTAEVVTVELRSAVIKIDVFKLGARVNCLVMSEACTDVTYFLRR